jgi:hypothetical protein
MWLSHRPLRRWRVTPRKDDEWRSSAAALAPSVAATAPATGALGTRRCVAAAVPPPPARMRPLERLLAATAGAAGAARRRRLAAPRLLPLPPPPLLLLAAPFASSPPPPPLASSPLSSLPSPSPPADQSSSSESAETRRLRVFEEVGARLLHGARSLWRLPPLAARATGPGSRGSAVAAPAARPVRCLGLFDGGSELGDQA